MCPPLTNDTWVYGADDDTLFRLIALGSDGLTKAGYSRVKHEVVTGPMPPFCWVIKTSDAIAQGLASAPAGAGDISPIVSAFQPRRGQL